jgi:hypothetical protein
VLPVLTPIESRYPTIQVSAIADGMTMMVWRFWLSPGEGSAASRSTR